MGQQGLVQELGCCSEVRRDVGVGEVVHLDAHVSDIHARVKSRARIDARTVGGVQDLGDAHALQPCLVDRHRPKGECFGHEV